MNGDGLVDYMIGEHGWSGDTGRVVILLGPVAIPGTVDLASYPISIELRGDSTLTDRFGSSLIVTDLDGDGLADILVRADTASVRGEDFAGSVSIYLGRASWPATLLWSDADWIFYGVDRLDGLLAATVGDLNGDGRSDLLLSAPSADGPSNSREGAGEAYVFFGPPSGWPSTRIDLAVDAPDVHIYGAAGSATNPGQGDLLGLRYLIADVLGDPIPDLILGAISAAGPTNTGDHVGEVRVVAGKASWPSTIDFRTSPGDFIVYGPGDSSQLQTIAVGDWDADGETDLILGAQGRDLTAPARANAGAIYVLRDRGTTVVRGWSTDPTAVVRPTQTTVYRLEVRCGDCSGPCFDDSAEVTITVEPDIIPPDLENTLRAVRRGIVDVEITELTRCFLYVSSEVWRSVCRRRCGERQIAPSLRLTRALSAIAEVWRVRAQSLTRHWAISE